MKITNLFIFIFLFYLQLSWGQNTVYHPEADRINNLLHTKLKVDFNFQDQTMDGEAWLTLSPHFYPTDSLTLDAKGMLIHKVEMIKPKRANISYNYENNQLKLNLGQEFNNTDSYEIYIKYTARPSEVKEEGSKAISDAKGLYFIDPLDKDPNKPMQIWTQGEPEASSCWFPTIDNLNQKTSQEIYMTVPSHFVTLSNGTLISQVENQNGTRTDYWKQTQKHAPYLFFMGAGDFAVINDTWKNIPVDYYVEKEYAPYAHEIFGNTPEMLTFFSDIFGYTYPWDKYAQIVVRDYVSGAMENTTAVVHLERAQQKHGQLVDENIWENTIAHEAAHHWFGDLVTTESWANLTLNESFANYSEYLWLEHKYGKAAADEHRFEDLQGYFVGGNYEKNLVRFHYADKQDMFDAVTYNKGGYILHMLRSYLGDNAFFKGLQKYLHDNKFGKAEAHQLRLALEEVSGKDLNWFFNQWYYGHGHPKLLIVTEYNGGKTQVNIKQQQENLFEFPLTIDIVKDNNVQRHQVWVKNKLLNTFTFEVENPELVIANADNDLLAEIEMDYSTEDYIQLYRIAKDEYTHRMLALQNLSSVQLSDESALQTMIEALSDPYEGIREQVLTSLDITNPKVKAIGLNKVISMAENEDVNLVRAAAIELLTELENSDYKNIYESALKSESFSVQAAGLTGLMDLDKPRAMELAKQLEDEIISSSPELLAAMIPYWKSINDTSHFDALAELAAFHAFIAMQDPSMAQPAKDAFVWIMKSDTPTSTSKILTMQLQVFNQMKESQPMALPFIKRMVEEGKNIKVEAAKQNPSASMENQIEDIQEVLDQMN